MHATVSGRNLENSCRLRILAMYILSKLSIKLGQEGSGEKYRPRSDSRQSVGSGSVLFTTLALHIRNIDFAVKSTHLFEGR